MPQQLSDKKKVCLNCGETTRGNFCAQCGQPTSTGKISFREIMKDFFGSTFALDGPLLKTIWTLIVNPGKLFREFIAGKRKTYFKPVAFFVLITAVYLILKSIIHFAPLEVEFKTGQEGLATISSGNKESLRLFDHNINNILFSLVFSIAFMLKLFFRKKYNLAEYTSIGFYIAGMFTILMIIMMFIKKFTAIGFNDIEFGILALFISYNSFSLFQKKNVGAIIKYLLVGILSLILYLIFAIVFFLLILLLR